jgi:hypothetical protein
MIENFVKITNNHKVGKEIFYVSDTPEKNKNKFHSNLIKKNFGKMLIEIKI